MLTLFDVNPKCYYWRISNTGFYSSNRISKLAPKKTGIFTFKANPIQNLPTGRINKLSNKESILQDCYENEININSGPEENVR